MKTFNFSREKFHSKSTTYKLIHSAVSSVVLPIWIYLLMLAVQNTSRPMSLRMAESILGTMIDMAPPIFWAILAFCICLLGVIKYAKLLFKEKKQENAENHSEEPN